MTGADEVCALNCELLLAEGASEACVLYEFTVVVALGADDVWLENTTLVASIGGLEVCEA